MCVDDLQQRIINLESLITHLQHDLEQMSSVLVIQRMEMKEQERAIRHLESRLAEYESDAEDRGFEDESPPHY
jgi:uncharacterized coiled-coil protein SlyX